MDSTSVRSRHLPRRRAAPSGITLDAANASVVKGMLARGDAQHAIAAWFGVNGGRIAEIATGHRFATVVAAPPDALPPSGPYPSVSSMLSASAELAAARDALDRAARLLRPT